MKALIPFLVLPLFVSSLAAQKTKLTDFEAIQAYEDGLLQNLKDGQYDALEDQFEKVQDRSVQIQDGTPKIWAYFRAFDLADEAKHKSLEDIKALAQQVRTWRDNRPNSVAALLELANTLIGQANKIRQLSIQNHWDLADPNMKQTLQEPLTEAAKIIFSPDKSVPAVQLQPECFAIAVALYCHFDHIPWPQIQDAVYRGVLLDPTYIALYQQALIWLSTRTPEATLPKPIDWITEILRVEPEDSQEAADQKAKTYAQTLAFTDQHRVPIDIQETDWPTFKRGLALLVHSYPQSTEWATRYLVLSYAVKDLPSAKDALDVLQGNYSPRVVGDPSFLQEVSIWAEN